MNQTSENTKCNKLNGKILVNSNLKILDEGLLMLSKLNQAEYQLSLKPTFESTIGAHFRHLMEHYRCFLDQYSSGEICYDKRLRDQRLENELTYAIHVMAVLQTNLSDINARYFNQTIMLVDQVTVGSMTTTLNRELLFLQSHSVHHYTTIAAMARMHGVQPEADFGVAIATLAYQSAES